MIAITIDRPLHHITLHFEDVAHLQVETPLDAAIVEMAFDVPGWNRHEVLHSENFDGAAEHWGALYRDHDIVYNFRVVVTPCYIDIYVYEAGR